MADNQKDLNIRVVTTADNSGAKSASDELNKLTDATGEAGKATDGLGDAEKEAAGHAEHLHVNHRALHQLMHVIGSETAPEMGHALGAATLGPLGGVLALAFAFEFLQKKLEAANEQAEKFANIQWEAGLESLNKYTSASNELADALAKASKSADPIKDKFEAGLKVLEAELIAHKNILAAMEKEDLAAAGNNEELKKSIQAKYEAAKTDYDSEGETRKLALRQEELDNKKAAQPGLEATAKYDEAKVKYAETDPAY